jgi:MFS family permease
MDVSTAEDKGQERPAATEAALDSGPAARPSSAAIKRTLIVGILLALAGAWITSTVADRFRGVENVEHGVKYRGTHLSIETATRNAAVAYGLLGAILSLSLGAIAGCLLGRFSIPRALTAGLSGIVLGASFGAASSYVLTPIYFNRMGTADITLTMLIHLGIWTAVGAAPGLAFAIGSGSRERFVGSFIGGMAGAALAAVLFDVCGAFLPLAHTERPLAEEPRTRLAAALVQSLFIVVGIVVVASQKPPATVKRTRGGNPGGLTPQLQPRDAHSR